MKKRHEDPTVVGQALLLDKFVLAKRIGKIQRTVTNYMQRGTIPFYKAGGWLRFDLEEVKRSLQQNGWAVGRENEPATQSSPRRERPLRRKTRTPVQE